MAVRTGKTEEEEEETNDLAEQERQTEYLVSVN
jgi:hypothetical protein